MPIVTIRVSGSLTLNEGTNGVRIPINIGSVYTYYTCGTVQEFAEPRTVTEESIKLSRGIEKLEQCRAKIAAENSTVQGELWLSKEEEDNPAGNTSTFIRIVLPEDLRMALRHIRGLIDVPFMLARNSNEPAAKRVHRMFPKL